MSEQRKHVVKLVEEILFHKGEQERREAELDMILGVRLKKAAGVSAKGESDSEKGTRDQLLEYMGKHRDRTVTAIDVQGELGITTSAFGYHMKNLLSKKKVKRMKRGHYQLRGKH